MKKFLISVVVAVACLSAVVSCGSSNPLVGRWNVVTYADPFKATMGLTEVATDRTYTLQFDENGTFWFTTDCNTVSGEYSVDVQSLQFGNLSATELACDREIVERCVKSELPMVVSFDTPDDSTLCLLGSQGYVLFKFVKTSSEPAK